MRLVLVSDTHCLHDGVSLPEGDVLIHAGDFCGWGTANELVRFCGWLSKQRFAHKLVVAGNHDRIVQQSRGQAEHFLREAGATYLQDSGAAIEGMSFWGTPWTPEFMNWAFMKRRGPDIDHCWRLIPPRVDVLIAHGPPKGILDAMESGGGLHVGCEMLAQRLQDGRLRPKLFVCGHNHAGHGRLEQDGVVYINAAQTNESVLGKSYELTHQPVVYDFATAEARVA